MSLHNLAQDLASRGRNGDSMLVHMTPGEVQGLQSIAMAHGGSLSVNPDTGLPEANFLKSILPMLAGAGLSMIPGVGPLMAAGIVGGGTALATKNLGQGLMAGLGAFGGAGLAGGLANLGASAAANAATAGGGLSSLGQAGATLADLAPGGTNAALGASAPTMSNIGTGLQAAAANPQSAITALGGAKQAAMTAGAAAAPLLTGAFNEQKVPTVTQQPAMIRPYDYEFQRTPESEMGPMTSRERLWGRGVFTAREPRPATAMAQGGLASLESNPYYSMTGDSADMFKYLMGQAPAPSTPASPAPSAPIVGDRIAGKPQFSYDPRTGQMTAIKPPEGAADAADAAKKPVPPEPTYVDGGAGFAKGGRLLSGPGDGVSDSIPAKIDGDRPARLATGEFVFDARTVSEIGNGDTRAGAKKLYAVMDAIHRTRATAKRGEPSGADRHLRHLLA